MDEMSERIKKELLEMDFSEVEQRVMAHLTETEKEAMLENRPLFNRSGTVTGRFSMCKPAFEDIPRKSNVPKEE